MGIRMRLTEALGITVPILSAPMGFVAGGKLAAAVTAAGGLGIIGAGYGDADWLDREVLPAADTNLRIRPMQRYRGRRTFMVKTPRVRTRSSHIWRPGLIASKWVGTWWLMWTVGSSMRKLPRL
jgi:hypothetical protein